MSYEEALVENACCQVSIEEQCENSLNHYLGISKVVHHWNSLIERAIKEYPRLKEIEKLTGEVRTMAYEEESCQCATCDSEWNGEREFCTNPHCPAVKLRKLLEKK